MWATQGKIPMCLVFTNGRRLFGKGNFEEFPCEESQSLRQPNRPRRDGGHSPCSDPCVKM